MAESKVRLPSGIEVVIKHKDGASEQDVLNFAFNEYVTNQDPGTKIGSSIAQGIDTLQQSYGSSIEGLGNILDAESLKQIGGDIVLKNQAEIDARLFRESQAPTDKTQVTKALDYVAELAGQSAPQMATSVGGAAIGGAIGLLGGPLAPFTVPAGAFLGGFISNVPYFYGSNRERQKESIERGYKLEVDEGAAMLAAIPQASLDSIIAAIGAKFIATPAMKIGGGVFTKVAAGSTVGSLTEIPTEIGQTVLERQQAGLPLSDDEAIKEYIDAGVGGAVLGGLFGGAGGAVSAVPSPTIGKKKDSKTQKSDLGKPVEQRSEIEVPREIQVTYQPVDGNPTIITLAIDKGEDAFTAAERILEGRRLPDSDMTVNEYFDTPLEVAIDEQEAVLEEDVPVDPVPVEQAPTPEPTPAPEPSVETAPEFDVDPSTGLPSFSLPQNLRKGQPGYYQTQNIKFASDLERAAYSATTSTRDETAKRKRAKYRKILQDAGYSSTEINQMGRELRSQMRDQYDGAGSELSVSLKEDAAPVAAVDELELTQEEIDIINQELDQELDPVAQAGDRLPSILDEKDITAKAFTPYRKEMMPKPEVVKAALPIFTKLKSGEKITTSESRQLASVIDRVNPVRPYKEVPPPASESDMLRGLEEGKREKINQARNLPTGTFVKLRLDIPAYRDHGVWVPTIHGATEKTRGFRGGKSISHQSTSVVTNAKFGIIGYDKPAGQVVATGIASKQETKVPIATILGQYVNLTEGQAVTRAEAAIKDPSFVQVGMDPKRRGYFYDRSSMQEVLSADEVIQVGPLVLAKNPVYGKTPRNEFLSREVEGAVDQDVVAQSAPLTSEQGSVNLTQNERKFFNSFLENQANREELLEEVPSLRINEGRLFIDSSDVDNLNNFISNVGISDGLGTVPPRLKTSQFYQPFLKYEKENTQEQSGTGATSAPAGNRLFSQPLQDATSVSERYQGTQGIRGQEPRRIVELDEERAAVIGKAYDKMKHDPKNPEVVRAYQALVKETLAQYDAILEDGYAMELSDVEYDNSQDMIEDVRNRKVMRVFSTEDGFGTEGITAKERRENPMLAESGLTDKNGKPLLVNDIFRFVHDFFGHGKLGNGFGPLGEENAWNVHSLMFSPLARRALTTETRGQNSWVNFSGVNDKAFEIRNQARQARADGDLKKAKRLAQKAYSSMRFAEQKIGLLPKEFSESNYQEDVTAQAADPAAEDRGPQETFDNINQLEDFISKSFSSIADKMGINIYPNMVGQFVAQYNVTQKIIEYNPRALLNRTKAGVQAAMREEIIHAAMHNVLIQKEKKARTGRSEDALWVDFFTALGNNLTPQERAEIQNVYQSLQEGNAVDFGSEYSRAVVQKFRYGDFTEQYIAVDKGGPAFQAIVDLLRSVQAYMAKVLGPMVKTDPEAAQVIVDTVELLNAIDPSIRPKSQQVVANAYSESDKNTAEENAEEDVAPKDASQRVREERKWWDGQLRSKLSKSLTPIITKLRRINPQFALLFQRLENTIRERSLKYKKKAQPFFNKLNSLKGDEFAEIKQLLFFSPTPDEANLPKNRATMQRRDALLHKHGLLNMYRLDVQPILEEIYAQYSELGMPIGYLEDYFPRVVKDLEGLIKSYGYETKKTFGNLVRNENARRKEEGLPEMESSERARFFQDFLQNKFSFGPKGVRPPGNVKLREIQTIPSDKLKFYEDPSIAFGNYTTNMVSAIEAYQVLGSTNQAGNKGETGKLGELTERLFQQGLIDEQDASELKSAAELATVQAGQELVPLRELGAATYVFTLIDVGTVLIQFLDLAKVLVLRGPTATAKGVYRTLTGNRVYDIEEDFSIVKKQIMAEFDQEGGTQKLLNLGLRYVVPFQKMDVFAKHATVEATLIDFLKKANAKVGSKPYRQLMTELTIKMGPDAAFKAVQGMRRDTFDKNSPEVKEAVMVELFDRQPLTYLQIPETHRRNPNSRLLYKLKTFMLLDINFNRELALNDLMGPDKTVKQRYKGLKMLVAMMAALTAIGVPKDLLLDFIRGKDTYLSDHVINNMLQVFGLSRYGVGTIFEDGPVDAIVDRFKPAAYSILDGTENDLLAWVKGDREISEFKVWKNLPVFDVWGRFTEDFQKKKEKLYREKRKEGQVPFIRR